MIITTTQMLDGYQTTEYLGIVRGLIVRSPNIVQGFLGGLKNIVGGRIGSFTQMCEQTRSEAFELMCEHAKQLGADAVIGVSYDTSELGINSTSEVLCYGTAVKLISVR